MEMQYDCDKEKAVVYLEYLERKYTEWLTHPKKKDRSAIGNEIRTVADLWDDTIYIALNQGRASGLFEHGFFQSDINRSLTMLREIISKPE